MTTLAIGNLAYGMAGTYGQVRGFTDKETYAYATYFNRAEGNHLRGKVILNRRGVTSTPSVHFHSELGRHPVFLYNLSYKELCEKCAISEVDPPKPRDPLKEIFKSAPEDGGINIDQINKIGINSYGQLTGVEIISLFSTWFVTSRKYGFYSEPPPQSNLFFKPSIVDLRAYDYLVAFRVKDSWWGLFLITSNPLIQGRYVNEIAEPDQAVVSYSGVPARGALNNGYGLLSLRSVGGLPEQVSQTINSSAVNERLNDPDNENRFIQPFSDISGNSGMMSRDGSSRNFTILP